MQASPLATCPAEARRLRWAHSIPMRNLFRGVKDCRVTQRNSLTTNISNANDTGFMFFANIADYLSQSRIMANMMTRQEALTLEPNLLGWGDVPPSAPFARSTIIHSCHLPCWYQQSVTEPPGLASPQSLKLIVWLHLVALPLFRGLTLIGQIRRFVLRVDTGASRAPPRLSHPIILRLQGKAPPEFWRVASQVLPPH